MDSNDSSNKKARIAWGGDHYIISDGLSTEYYINLQKEKVAQEKKDIKYPIDGELKKYQMAVASNDINRSLDDIIREKRAQQVGVRCVYAS